MKGFTYIKEELTRAMQHLYRLAEDSLAGRELSSAERLHYQGHPEAWQERSFHISMAVLHEARSLNRAAQDLALSHATKIPGEALLKVLSNPLDCNPDVERALDCWEVDRELAYEQLGSKFNFPPLEEAPRRHK